MSTWLRTQGQVTAPHSRVLRAAGFLDEACVVAILEADPEEQAAVWITVATDEDMRVAVLDVENGTIVPGPPLAELTEALAQECEGSAIFGDITVVAPGEDEDPFEPHLDVTSVAERTVVLLHDGRDEVERLATALGFELVATPLVSDQPDDEDIRADFGDAAADGTESDSTEEHAASKPNTIAVLMVDAPNVDELADLVSAVVLERRTMYSAITGTQQGAHTHVWGLERAVIPQRGAAPEFAERVLGYEALADDVRSTFARVCRSAVLTALHGDGLSPFPALLGLPEGLSAEIVEFLAGEREPGDVTGAQTVAPVGLSELMRRRAHAAADDARHAAHHARKDARQRTQRAAEDARRRALRAREDARSGAAALAEASEDPQARWVPLIIGTVELVAGVALLRRAGGRPDMSDRSAMVRKVGGGFLLAGAVANFSVAGLAAVARRGRRKAKES